jgi:hypothetical protein
LIKTSQTYKYLNKTFNKNNMALIQKVTDIVKITAYAGVAFAAIAFGYKTLNPSSNEKENLSVSRRLDIPYDNSITNEFIEKKQKEFPGPKEASIPVHKTTRLENQWDFVGEIKYENNKPYFNCSEANIGGITIINPQKNKIGIRYGLEDGLEDVDEYIHLDDKGHLNIIANSGKKSADYLFTRGNKFLDDMVDEQEIEIQLQNGGKNNHGVWLTKESKEVKVHIHEACRIRNGRYEISTIWDEKQGHELKLEEKKELSGKSAYALVIEPCVPKKSNKIIKFEKQDGEFKPIFVERKISEGGPNIESIEPGESKPNILNGLIEINKPGVYQMRTPNELKESEESGGAYEIPKPKPGDIPADENFNSESPPEIDISADKKTMTKKKGGKIIKTYYREGKSNIYKSKDGDIIAVDY